MASPIVVRKASSPVMRARSPLARCFNAVGSSCNQQQLQHHQQHHHKRHQQHHQQHQHGVDSPRLDNNQLQQHEQQQLIARTYSIPCDMGNTHHIHHNGLSPLERKLSLAAVLTSPANLRPPIRSNMQASPLLTPSVEFSATRRCEALVQSPSRKSSFKWERRRLYRRNADDLDVVNNNIDDDCFNNDENVPQMAPRFAYPSVASSSTSSAVVDKDSGGKRVSVRFEAPKLVVDCAFSADDSVSSEPTPSTNVTLSVDHLTPKSALPAVTAKLGKGGFGAVVAGRYDGQKVAIKYLNSKSLAETVRHGSLCAELNAFRLKHCPNVVGILAFTSCGPAVQVVYEYVGRRNLQALLDSADPINCNKRLNICWQVANGLRYCHANKVLHMDVKPANVLMTDDEMTFKLADFGCSKIMDQQRTCVSTPATPLSSSNDAKRRRQLGTLIYQAPELLKGDPPSTKADVFSYSILAWQCLARRQPYAGLHAHTAVFQIVSAKLRPDLSFLLRSTDTVGHHYGRTDVELADVIQLCWHAEPGLRPECQKICELLERIRTSLN